MLPGTWFRRSTTPRRAGFRPLPCLEGLEERCVMATLVGLTSTATLVRFDSSTPGTLTTLGTISGLAPGQTIASLAFRPSNGLLYGMGFGSGTGQLYLINPTTAVASPVGTPFSTKLVGTQFSLSFDPVADKVRIISNVGENLRVDPNSGALISTDTNITPSDTVLGIAYDHYYPGATLTTLFGYDTTTGKLVTVGNVNGAPFSPNSGALANVGVSGVIAAPNDLGFSIDANGTAYMNIDVGGKSGLYTANLVTGGVTLVNGFGPNIMVDIAVAPAASFLVSGFPSVRTTGLSSPINVTAETLYGTVATGYSGTVALTSSDPAAVLPGNSTLTNGVGTFNVILKTPGSQSLTASDTVTSRVTGSQIGITVLPNTELVGLTTTNQLMRFNSETPGLDTVIGAITGLSAGQNMVGIAFRPQTGGLYGLGVGAGGSGDVGQIYQIDPVTAVATAVGAPFSSTISGRNFGFTFDPVQDIIRVTTDASENFRISPITGALISQDTILTPATANVIGLAYDNNVNGASTTTLYGYDVSDDNLVTIGSVGGSPNSPNTGIVNKIGPSGITSAAGAASKTGLAIDANGAAYANLFVNNQSGLYNPNLATGLSSFNGLFAGSLLVREIAVAPAVSFAFVGLGATHVDGANSPFTVEAVDAYGNIAAGYQGTVHFTSSDAAAALPANLQLVDGVGTSTVTFNSLGTETLTATDSVNSAVTGTVSVPIAASTDLVGLTTGGQLVRFSSAAPNSITTVGTIGGVTAGQTLVGLDFRPANSQLYALGFGAGTGQVYQVNPTTAVATPLGSSFALNAADTSFGFGFDPVNDVIRVTSNTGENLRVSPSTGALILADSALTPASTYSGVAYSNNVRGATSSTLYAYDFNNNKLVTIGSPGGTPNSPNTGLVTVVGPSGVTVTPGTAVDTGFDIGGDGLAYLSLVSGSSGLYMANLNTGALSLIGNLGTGITLVGLSEAPAAAFTVTGFPSPIAPGTAGTFTVTAVDAYGVPVPNYQNTVTFSSSDPSARLPANTALTNGTGTFTATFQTPGTQSLTVSDLTVPTINGTQSNITVSALVPPPPPPPPPGPPGPPPPPPGTHPVDKIAVVQLSPPVRTAVVVQDINATGIYTANDPVFSFGLSSDKFVTGDWAGLGYDSVGIARTTSSGVLQWALDSNGNNTFDSGDTVYSFGSNGDTPVAGDWTGSGTTKIGVVQAQANGAAVWVLDTSGTGVYNSGDFVTSYGESSDTFVTGDWNGSGTTKIGVVRQTASGVLQWVLNTTGSGTYSSGDTVYNFGMNGDIPVVGDWTGSGKTEIGVVRPTTSGVLEWILDTSGTGSYTPSDVVYFYGANNSAPLVGNWQGSPALFSGDGTRNASVPTLKPDAQFVATIDQAILAWQQAGLSPQLVQRLETATYSVAPLGDSLLGETSGNHVTIDSTAQGHGWSESPTPQPGQMDLFTTLEHEMGHVLGLPDQSTQQNDLMFQSLLPGVRKLPTTQDIDAVFASLNR